MSQVRKGAATIEGLNNRCSEDLEAIKPVCDPRDHMCRIIGFHLSLLLTTCMCKHFCWSQQSYHTSPSVIQRTKRFFAEGHAEVVRLMLENGAEKHFKAPGHPV